MLHGTDGHASDIDDVNVFIAYNVHCVNSIIAVTEIVLLSSVSQQKVTEDPVYT